MKSNRATLATALFFNALAVLTFAGINLIAAPVWFVFQRGTSIGMFNTVAQISAWIATAVLFLAAALIAIPLALAPARRFSKLLNALPAYLLAFTLAAILANQFGIATLGSLTNPPALKISLATAWLGVGAVTSLIAVVIAAVRATLNEKILRAAILSPLTILCIIIRMTLLKILLSVIFGGHIVGQNV